MWCALLVIGTAAFLAGIFADGRVSDGDIRAAGLVLVLLSVGAIAYRRLRAPYRRIGDADLIDVIAYIEKQSVPAEAQESPATLGALG